MARHVPFLALLAGVCLLSSSLTAEAATVCLLKLAIDPKQSLLTGRGSTSAPFEGKVATTKTVVTGNVWLRVPANSSCPPKLTAANVDALLQQASLEVPVGAASIMAGDEIKSNVTLVDDPTNQIAQMDFYGLGMGLTGASCWGSGHGTVCVCWAGVS